MTHVLPNGHLKITAGNALRADLAEAFRLGGYPRAEETACEHLRSYGYEFVLPETINALTEAPILTHDPDYPDEGGVVPHEGEPVFWFPNYMVEDPWRTLADTGRVVFTRAPD